MNLFLKKGFIFFSLLLVYFFVNMFINLYFINSEKNKYELTTKYLVMGDSHTRKAINPGILISASNISQDSEPYFITYWKLREILSNNRIDTIILGFSYHNLSEFNDKKLIDPKWSNEMFQRIYSIEDFNSLNNIKVDYFLFYKVFFKNMCLNPKTNHKYYIGSYSNSFNSNIKDYKDVINRHYYYNNKKQGVSSEEIKYFRLIKELCKIRKVKLILVTTPINSYYFNRIPNEFTNAFESLKEEIKNENIEIFDFGNMHFNEDEFFNSDHLNEKGALRFTKELQKVL